MAVELSQHEEAGRQPACFQTAHGLEPEVFVDEEVFRLARSHPFAGHLDRERKNARVTDDPAFVRPQEGMQRRPRRAIFTPMVHLGLRHAGLRKPAIFCTNGLVILVAWQRSANEFEIKHRVLRFHQVHSFRR